MHGTYNFKLDNVPVPFLLEKVFAIACC
jgi:hypothetical protein